MSKKIIVGNWKMNPATLTEAKHIVRKIKSVASTLGNVEVIMCPPAVFAAPCSPKRGDRSFHLGSQDVSFESGGAHTGEISALMLTDIGVEYVLVGHSERRKVGDTDLIVSKKVKAILEEEMIAVVCVGEDVREENGVYLDTLKEQIKVSLAGISHKQALHIVLAYEPVWAIGAKEAMAPEQIYEMSLFVKKIFADIFGQDAAMKLKVLYGGSANFRNAADIVNVGKVDGLLVGRESVNAAGFIEMLKAVDSISG